MSRAATRSSTWIRATSRISAPSRRAPGRRSLSARLERSTALRTRSSGYMTRYCVVRGRDVPVGRVPALRPRARFPLELVADSGHWSSSRRSPPGDVFDGIRYATSYRGRAVQEVPAVTAYVATRSSASSTGASRPGEATSVTRLRQPAGDPLASRRTSRRSQLVARRVYGFQTKAVAQALGPRAARADVASEWRSRTRSTAHGGPWARSSDRRFSSGSSSQVTASRKVFTRGAPLRPLASSGGTQVAFSDDFDLERLKNVKVKIGGPVDNA